MTDPITPADIPTMRPPGVLQFVKRVLGSGETILLLTGAQLKSGNRDKLLGHVWSLLDPLLMLSVYYLVFGIGFRQAGDAPREFVFYLFAGIVAWRFFGDSVGQSTGCLRSQRGLILSSDFPKAVIPIAICCARAYDLIWALIVVVFTAWIGGIPITYQILWLPGVIVVHVMLTLGACLLVAYLGLFFADTANIISAFLRLWVLASPIFYFARSEHGRNGIIPPEFIDYYMLNPIVGLLDAYRDVLIWGETPSAGEFGYVVAFAIVILAAGIVVFSRGEGTFAKYV
jgi:lipopolysaccharide transport system permease protein